MFCVVKRFLTYYLAAAILIIGAAVSRLVVIALFPDARSPHQQQAAGQNLDHLPAVGETVIINGIPVKRIQ